MYSLILLIIIGLGMAYFSTQNIAGVPLTLANYTLTGVPLYMIVIGSLLLGILMSWVISMMNSISSMITMHGKDTALSQAQQTIKSLEREKHKLEVENARLSGTHNQKVVDKSDEPTARPTFLSRLRHNV